VHFGVRPAEDDADACGDRQTATYSNRFATHIICQHQFLALCHERGWRYQLQGAFFPSLQ
jgi:hypothetical protein